MRIGLFSDSYYPHVSGVSTSVEMLRETLEKMGHRVFVVAPNLYDNKFKYDKGNGIIWLPGIKTGIYNTKLTRFYSSRAMFIIKNEWKLDIIHSHTEFGVGYFSRIVSRKLKIPIVHTYHTLYEDYLHYIAKGKHTKLLKKIVIKLTRYYCDKKCDELIVPTNKIKKLFNSKYNIKRKMHVIPSGIDLRKFYPNEKILEKVKTLKRRYKIKDKDFVLGSVGRIASEKSFDKIIYNLKDLVAINSNIKLMLVGDGPDIDNLKQLTKELELEGNVVFTGLVDYSLIESFYQVFDVLVSYSKTETQGLTIIEGLAANKPAICIKDDSFREMVRDGYNGFLVKNDKEFKEKVLFFIKDNYTYTIMCRNARASVENYSKEAFANNILKVYELALEKKKAKKKGLFRK